MEGMMAAADSLSVPSIRVALKQAKWRIGRKKSVPQYCHFPMLRFLSHSQSSTRGRGTNAACAICLWRVTFFSPLSLYNCFCVSLFSLFSSPCFPIPIQPLRREVIEGSDLFGSGFLYLPKAYEHFYCNMCSSHVIHEIWLISFCNPWMLWCFTWVETHIKHLRTREHY